MYARRKKQKGLTEQVEEEMKEQTTKESTNGTRRITRTKRVNIRKLVRTNWC